MSDPEDLELEALNATFRLFAPMDDEQRRRVLKYICVRFDLPHSTMNELDTELHRIVELKKKEFGQFAHLFSDWCSKARMRGLRAEDVQAWLSQLE